MLEVVLELSRRATTPILFVLVVVPWGLAPASARAAESPSLSDLPGVAQATVSAAVGRDDTEYHAVSPAARVYDFANRLHSFEASLSDGGVEVRFGALNWRMRLRRYGYGAELTDAPPAIPVAEANRVEYRRDELTEWYINGPQGLEQGFTFDSPPGAADGPLTVEIEVAGHFRAGNNAIVLTDAQGAGAILDYGGLHAYDARGRDLPAWLETGDRSVVLRVDDSGAQYPVVVDPFVQKAKLTAADGATNDWFGTAVSIDGDTIVVGAQFDDVGANADQGSAYVFVRPGGGWANMTQTAKLTASDGAAADLFGYSVAVSGDTVVVGAYDDNIGTNDDQGSAYVFVRPSGGWSSMTQTAKLTASDGGAGEFLGWSVAIDGDTIVAGAYQADVGAVSAAGAAYVFVKPGGGWADMTQTARLIASDGLHADQFAQSVAIDGDTVVVGANNDDTGVVSNHGSAYIFVKPGGGWVNATQAAKLTALDAAADDLFGYSVAISADTVLVGAHADDIGANTNQGSAYVFVKPGGGWADMTQTAKLTASDGAPFKLLGWSVGIDGDTAVVGAREDASVYVFNKPGGGWVNGTQNAKLTAADAAPGDYFSWSTAINGGTVVVGAYNDDIAGNSDQGSAYVFENIESTATPTSSASATPTQTPTHSLTQTASATPTETPTHTETAVPTPSATVTPTATPSATPTQSATPIPTTTPTATPLVCATPLPSTSCKQVLAGRRARFKVRDRSRDAFDVIEWTWKKGQGTAAAELGDPTTSTAYAFCVFDGDDALIFGAGIAAGSHWSRNDSGGTRITYRDPDLSANGIRVLKLIRRGDQDERLRLYVTGTGKKNNLGNTTAGGNFPDLTFPLVVAPSPVRVQLVNSDGYCWESRYQSEIRQNEVTNANVSKFTALADPAP